MHFASCPDVPLFAFLTTCLTRCSRKVALFFYYGGEFLWCRFCLNTHYLISHQLWIISQYLSCAISPATASQCTCRMLNFYMIIYIYNKWCWNPDPQLNPLSISRDICRILVSILIVPTYLSCLISVHDKSVACGISVWNQLRNKDLKNCSVHDCFLWESFKRT